MESLGQYLRGQRGTRGMSLEEVSLRTRIRLQTLEALERDDFTALPAEVTVKGFLRSYARCLGLVEQDVLARFQQFASEYFHIAQESDPVSRVVQSDRHRLRQHHLTIGGLVAAGLMVVLSGVALWSPRGTQEHPTAISSPLQAPPPVIDAPRANEVPADLPPASVPQAPNESSSAPTTLAPAPPSPPTEAAVPQRLVITANEPSWVQAFIDDAETREALMQPGERLEWSAKRHVRLTVGNAGGVSVEFNGEAVASLGASGRVRTVVLPRGAVSAAPPAPKQVAAVPPAPKPSATVPPVQSQPGPPALTSPADSTTVPAQPL
jgi:cytoskeletal protein RodZ